MLQTGQSRYYERRLSESPTGSICDMWKFIRNGIVNYSAVDGSAIQHAPYLV